MAILVTGGAGYIGSATVDRLHAKGEQIVVLDDLSRGNRSSVHNDVPFTKVAWATVRLSHASRPSTRSKRACILLRLHMWENQF